MTDHDGTRGPVDRVRVGRPDACPDEEALAAYIDGTLAATDRAAVEAHLTRCADCREIVAETARFREAGVALKQPAAAPRNRRAVWAVAASVLVAAAVLVLAVWVVKMPVAAGPNARPVLAALVAAVGDHRPVEPRLTGGFAYGPPPSPMRGASTGELDPDVQIAVARIEKLARAYDTPDNEGALGVAYLVSGDVDKAVDALEDAVGRQPGNGDLQSDLAAAYLVRARRLGRAEDYPKALAAAERAIKADPSLIEAWFNRALALEDLSLTDEAKHAWRDYLKHDARSKWADEARRRLKTLDAGGQVGAWRTERRTLLAALDAGDRGRVEAIVRRLGQQTRELVENDLLPAWANRVLAGHRRRAAQALVRAERLAVAVADVHHDRLPLDAVRAVERAGRVPARCLELARAHKAFQEGQELYANDQLVASERRFAAAEAGFASTGSPFVEWARYWLAVGVYHEGDHPRALAELVPLGRRARAAGYLNLEGRVDWLAGLIHALDGDLGGSLVSYRHAAAEFSRTGEVDHGAMLRILFAETYDLVGEPEQAWTQRRKALAQLAASHDARLRYVLYESASQACLRDSLPEAALHFQNALVAEVRKWGPPTVQMQAFLHRAQIERRLGRPSQAADDLGKAAQALKRVDDRTMAAPLQVDLLIERAALASTGDPSAAIRDLSRGIVLARAVGEGYRISALYLAEGRAFAGMHDRHAAEQALLDGIRVFEGDPAHLHDVDMRASYLNGSWGLFGDLIALESAAGRGDEALSVAELGRARPGSGRSLAWARQQIDALTRDLPADAAVLYYATLNDRLLGWVITRNGRRMFEEPVGQSRLAQLVTRVVRAIRARKGGDSSRAATTSLYDDLIRPAADQLRDADRLIIVPAGPLGHLPFAALVDPGTGRFLVQQRAIQFVPSAAALVRTIDDHRGAPLAPPFKVLAVGNPAFDRAVFPDLPALPGAADEVAAIRRVFPNADRLVGAAATKSAFLREAGRYQVVHFAGHAIVNPLHPAFSRLLFAPDPGSNADDGVVLGRDVERMRFPATRLVVLAACRSADGATYQGQRVLGLAGSWLSAGVPTVVASLWDVDDAASRDLFAAFYPVLRAVGDPVVALRQAQLAMLHSGRAADRRPAAWAGAVVFGGGVPQRAAHPALAVSSPTSSRKTFARGE
ncbi:MAG TPA: CHAT domain-containing protein [Vicinamibacterales bacterium]|nr:CHAT domain-containing protein [Vicinamibacterales bacterium]